MGYSTSFTGAFLSDRPFDEDTYQLLRGIGTTRRMKRAGLDTRYGIDGEFFYNPHSDCYGQERDPSIVDYNAPPSTQPGLWCQWVPSDDRQSLMWDGQEKFYAYIAWVKYLIEKIIIPRGYTLTGHVYWQGQDTDDFGTIAVNDNMVRIKERTLEP